MKGHTEGHKKGVTEGNTAEQSTYEGRHTHIQRGHTWREHTNGNDIQAAADPSVQLVQIARGYKVKKAHLQAFHSIILARVYQADETSVTSARASQGGETSVISARVYQGDDTSVISARMQQEYRKTGGQNALVNASDSSLLQFSHHQYSLCIQTPLFPHPPSPVN